MTVEQSRPWLAQYPLGVPADLVPEFTDALTMFRAAVARDPDRTAVSYFGGQVTLRQLDLESDALASALLAHGFSRGDRAALYLQNVPQYLIAVVATWKAGGILVSINPMSRQRELAKLLSDSGAVVLVCLDELYDEVAREVLAETDVRVVITTSALEYRARDDDRLFAKMTKTHPAGTLDLAELVTQFSGQQPAGVEFSPDDIALLTYTSGTTGTPKGAMNTHGNVTFTAQVVRDWCQLSPGEVILGVAPLFHITGLIAGIAVSFLLPAELVLIYRFEPGVLLDAIRERRPTFTVAAITVFIAIADLPGVTRADLACLRSAYSGGAPVTPTWAKRFKNTFGVTIHSMYGLTETTSPSHAVPFGAQAPIDPTSGALSVGVPVPNTMARIVDDERNELPVGEVGEIVISGPQVVPGYWNQPDETEHAIPGGQLHTGDVGFMDERGFFYVVDRKKDMINASGYKVWPREVEDVLCEHESVSEAAVVGVPDEYRGETVKAFVTLRRGAVASERELIDHCKARMSAYKYPRSIDFMDQLPKTLTGKLLRRELPRSTNTLQGLDLGALDAYLNRELPGRLAGPLSGRLIAGGRSNLTYLVTDGSQQWVVRRPPLGHVLETAHDMRREYRVMHALRDSAVPVPEMLALCRDTDVLGATFYVMSFIEGTVYRTHDQLADVGPAAARNLADNLIDVLAQLHGVDTHAAGLTGLGCPEGYLERQVQRWGKQLTASHSRDVPGLTKLGLRLAGAVPVSQHSTLVHGDYKLDNVVVEASDHGRILAVLDWEMATLGDPLMDLVNVVLWWDGVRDSDGLAFAAVPAELADFPASSRLLDRYATATGADLDALPWYLGLACYKLAGIFEGMYYRHVQGLTVGDGFERLAGLAPALARRGHDFLDR